MTYTTKAIDDRDRVIARLLDGWQPHKRHWRHFGEAGSGLPIQYAEMSDGEAAIIRAHQERT